MGRILAIDFGTKRIGLARSDPMKQIASPFKVIEAGRALEESAERICAECIEIEKIVLGLPLLLSGEEGEMSCAVRALALILEKRSALPVALLDERLTSKEVEKAMIAGGVKRKKRSQMVDLLSATLILQTYLYRS